MYWLKLLLKVLYLLNLLDWVWKLFYFTEIVLLFLAWFDGRNWHLVDSRIVLNVINLRVKNFPHCIKIYLNFEIATILMLNASWNINVAIKHLFNIYNFRRGLLIVLQYVFFFANFETMLNRYILGMFSLNVPFLLDSFGKNHEHNKIFFNILLLQTKVSGSIACRYFFKEKYFCLYLFGSVMFNPKSYFTIGERADTTKYSCNIQQI